MIMIKEDAVHLMYGKEMYAYEKKIDKFYRCFFDAVGTIQYLEILPSMLPYKAREDLIKKGDGKNGMDKKVF